MPLFTSSRERILWLWTGAVLVAIFASLFLGRPLANQLRDQDTQAVFFLIGLFLVAAVIIVYGLKSKPGSLEWATILGITAVYIMFVFRLGAPERSHLIEYSVLAIFIHKAMKERDKQVKLIARPPFLASILAILLGILDECIQILLPNRVFDPEDIVFNGLAVLMAIGSSSVLTWGRKRTKNNF